MCRADLVACDVVRQPFWVQHIASTVHVGREHVPALTDQIFHSSAPGCRKPWEGFHIFMQLLTGCKNLPSAGHIGVRHA